MAVWEVRVVATNGTRSWENVWDVDVGSLEDVPSTVIEALHTYHLEWLLVTYELVKIVRRPKGSHDEFIESIYNEAGGRSTGGNEVLPLFNTAKVFLQAAVGRPGFKFLRGLLLASDLVAPGGVLASGLVSSLESTTATLLAAIISAACELTVGTGDKLVTATDVQGYAQMRQEHRKRKKKV